MSAFRVRFIIKRLLDGFLGLLTRGIPIIRGAPCFCPTLFLHVYRNV